MSYPAITLYELANCRYADLLRDAAEQRAIQEAQVAQRGRSSRLGSIVAAIRVVFRHEPRLTAAGAQDPGGNTAAASQKPAIIAAAKSSPAAA